MIDQGEPSNVRYLVRRGPDLATAVAEFDPEVARRMACVADATDDMRRLEKLPAVQDMLQRSEASFGSDVPGLVADAADAWEVAMNTPSDNPARVYDIETACADRWESLAERIGDRSVAEALVYRWLVNGKRPYDPTAACPPPASC